VPLAPSRTASSDGPSWEKNEVEQPLSPISAMQAANRARKNWDLSLCPAMSPFSTKMSILAEPAAHNWPENALTNFTDSPTASSFIV
jgi:hypothetical protein